MDVYRSLFYKFGLIDLQVRQSGRTATASAGFDALDTDRLAFTRFILKLKKKTDVQPPPTPVLKRLNPLERLVRSLIITIAAGTAGFRCPWYTHRSYTPPGRSAVRPYLHIRLVPMRRNAMCA